MPSLTVTTIYAAALAALVMGLALYVISLRRRHHVSLGDDGHPDLRAAIRTHGNLVEYAPLAIVLLALLEYGGGQPWLLHACGGSLLVGRILHAASMLRGGAFGRTVGMWLTFLSLTGLVVGNLYEVLAR